MHHILTTRSDSTFRFTSRPTGFTRRALRLSHVEGLFSSSLRAVRNPTGAVWSTAWPPQGIGPLAVPRRKERSEEHTSELQSLMRISYAVICLKKKTHKTRRDTQID